MRFPWRVLAALGWVLAFAYSFAPFDVSLDRIAASASFAEPVDRGYLASLILHLLTFAVLGVVDRLGRRGFDALDFLAARVFAAGALLCVLIEAGQIFLASRHAELVDLAVNVAGLALGNVAAGVLVRLAPARPWTAPHALRSRNVRSVYVAVWGLVWSAAILSPARLAALESWDPTYALLVGDEKGGERRWQGELAYLAFYDRTFTADQVSGRLRIPPNTLEGKTARLEAGLVAGYDFTKTDKSVLKPEGMLKDPALRIELPAHSRWVEEPPSALVLGDGPLIKSAGAAGQLSTRLASGNAFSVEAWLRPATLEQTGTARITTISESPFRRNVTLGQEADAYHFRVRNRFNGENGSNHELICAGAAPSAFQQIVATYDRGVSTMFRDGRVMCPAVDLREPSVMLHLGTGRISGMVTALIAAVSLMLVAGPTGELASVGRLLVVGYAWLLASFVAGFFLSFPPASSLIVWFGPALALSSICLTRGASQVPG